MGIQKFLFAELMGAILAIKIAIKNQCLARVWFNFGSAYIPKLKLGSL